MIKKKNIPTILGLVILVIGTFAGVFFLGAKQIFRIGADSSVSPKDIRASNISDTGATISWTTDKPTTDFIVWGEGKSSVSQVLKEDQSDQKFFTHSINLSGLKPNTTYFYKINSEGNEFDNKGIPWELTTGAPLNESTFPIVMSGSVINATGVQVKRALVYANVSGYLLSTLTSDSGTFVFQLGSARNQDLQSYVSIDPAQTTVELSVQAGADGDASATIFPQSGNPVPPMVLGQVYDFRNLQPSAITNVPNANLNLPNTATKTSKFSLPIASGTPTPTSVILESLKEGETVTSTKPAFFGRGPKGEAITITVQSSNPMSQTLIIAKDGTWTWSPPSDLAPGAHTVTISWIDGTGVTRNLIRTFIVQAGELPAFVATPSQTIAPSASPTGTPSATATPLPTPTPRPTSTASAAPVPITGDTSPTMLLSMIGIAVLAFSFAVWKISEN